MLRLWLKLPIFPEMFQVFRSYSYNFGLYMVVSKPGSYTSYRPPDEGEGDVGSAAFPGAPKGGGREAQKAWRMVVSCSKHIVF